MMRSFKRLVSVSTLLLSVCASQAALADGTFVFTSITGIHYTNPNPMTGATVPATLTVVMAGSTAPTVYPLPGNLTTECEGFFLDMMRAPGVYTVTVATILNLNNKEVLTGCSLDRV